MEKELDGEEVVVEIQNTEDKSKNEETETIQKQDSGSISFKKYLQIDPPPVPTTIQPLQPNQDQKLISMAQSPYPKAKSRVIEPPIHRNIANDKVTPNSSPSQKPKTPIASTPITPKTPLITSPQEDDDDDAYFTKVLQEKKKKKRPKKMKLLVGIEISLFISVTVVLILSKTVDKLEKCEIWSLGLWKWCVLVLAIFCGRLFSEWFTNGVVFLIEREFLLKKKVLYFVYSLQKSVRVFIWLGLILLTWGLLINRGVRRSRNTQKVLNYITRGIASTLAGAGAWIIKTLIVKILASKFHVNVFFDRIQESIFHQYILQRLSGTPSMWDLEKRGMSFKSSTKGVELEGKKDKGIDVNKLQKMKRGKVSGWTMKGLIKVIRKKGFSTLSNEIDSSEDIMGQDEQKDGTITCEWEAQNAGVVIFENVARHEKKYITRDDLLLFMNKDDVEKVLPLFEGAVETGKIKKKSFCYWVVNVYKERKFLALSLNDAKTAVEELNKLVSGLTVFILLILWLLLMGIASTEVLLFISSQCLLGIFMFGNSAKTAFEAIIFVFVMHPFDVGDRCVVDGVQVVVEEVNILTTVFLRYDNEKIYYPNSILATKAISNFNRSPEMSDSVEFDVDVSTSVEDILALKAKIKTYIDGKPRLWRQKHSVRVREIEDVNKMKMSLYVTHTINFQNHEEKSDRRSNLVLELKNIFEELGIKYHLLPQEILIKYVGSASPPATTATRLS